MSESIEPQSLSISATEEVAPSVPKKRGRPRKVDAQTQAQDALTVSARTRRTKAVDPVEAPAPKVEVAAVKAESGTKAVSASDSEPAARPRRSARTTSTTGEDTAASSDTEELSPAPRRRGRPRKVEVEARAQAQADTSIASKQEAAEEHSEESTQASSAAVEAATTESGGTDKREDHAGGSRRPRLERKLVKSKKFDRQERFSGKQHQRKSRRYQRDFQPSVTKEELAKLKVAELKEKAAELELDITGLKKAELVESVFAATVKSEGFVDVEGILDIMAEGYGFLRTQGYLPSETDVYVANSVIRRNHLRKGDKVKAQMRQPRENEKYGSVNRIVEINDIALEDCAPRIRFADLTPVYPDERLVMEHGKQGITARVIDLAAPIGKGQRGLIVSPPKAGKTTILKDIAAAITANNPEVYLMCLLVDERPEEVTDMERSIRGEVISSTFDMPCENHIAVSELVIERAKRLVEQGKDVVILLDSLTRLARAYNLAQPASGRILSGGVDSTALYPPKKFLGAARNIENGGSLTILASALIDTGSKMDEVIFEEFKGTGNMELKLDRNLADRRIFPAIDPIQSGTRKEDLLMNPQEAPLIWAVRRVLSNMNNTERAMDTLIKSLKQTDNNEEFLLRTAKKAQNNKQSGSDLSLGL